MKPFERLIACSLLIAMAVMAGPLTVQAQLTQAPQADADFGGPDENDADTESTDEVIATPNDTAEYATEPTVDRDYYRAMIANEAEHCMSEITIAVRQDRGRAQRRSHPEHMANDCVQLLEPSIDGSSEYGGFINTCEHQVALSFCSYNSDPESWAASFDCERGTYGLITLRGINEAPENQVGALTADADEIHYGACRYPESIPADTEFDQDARAIRFRCHAWLQQDVPQAAAEPETRAARLPQQCEQNGYTAYADQYRTELQLQVAGVLAGTTSDDSTDLDEFEDYNDDSSADGAGSTNPAQGNTGIDLGLPATGNGGMPGAVVCRMDPFRYAMQLITRPTVSKTLHGPPQDDTSLNVWLKSYFVDAVALVAQLPGCDALLSIERYNLQRMRDSCNESNTIDEANGGAAYLADCNGKNLLSEQEFQELEAVKADFLNPDLWNGPVSESCRTGISRLKEEDKIRLETLANAPDPLATWQYEMYTYGRLRDHYQTACAGSPEYPNHFFYSYFYGPPFSNCIASGYDAQTCVPRKAW